MGYPGATRPAPLALATGRPDPQPVRAVWPVGNDAGGIGGVFRLHGLLSCDWSFLDRVQPPRSARFNTFCVIRCTRSSGPCGRLQWDQGSMCPGGELMPWDQKIVEALNTKLPFGPG